MAIDALNEVPLAKRNLGILTRTGRTYRVDFSERPQAIDPDRINWEISLSKAIFGKFQFTRTRAATLDEIEFENILHTTHIPTGASGDLKVTVPYSLDGKNITGIKEPVVLEDSPEYMRCAYRVTGRNFSVQLSGQFNVNTFILTGHVSGRR